MAKSLSPSSISVTHPGGGPVSPFDCNPSYAFDNNDNADLAGRDLGYDDFDNC